MVNIITQASMRCFPCSGRDSIATILPSRIPMCRTASSPDSGSSTRPFLITTSNGWANAKEHGKTMRTARRITARRMTTSVAMVTASLAPVLERRGDRCAGDAPRIADHHGSHRTWAGAGSRATRQQRGRCRSAGRTRDRVARGRRRRWPCEEATRVRWLRGPRAPRGLIAPRPIGRHSPGPSAW